jgi:flagella basal body P-ring formation protein FlgA
VLTAGYAGASPAQLRLQVRLDAGVIKVADLWENAGAKADTVIGSAPPPGRSIAIEAAQLAYIAHLYDVDWRPVSGVERTSVERAGRPLTHEEMMEPIKRSLMEAGASPSVTIEFANLAPILVPPSSFPLLQVEAMAYDPGTDRFSADLVASTEGMQTQRMRIAGRVLDMVTAIVAGRRLEPGDVITAIDVHSMQIAGRRLVGPAASDISQVLGQTPKRTIVAGQPLAMADVGAPVMVPKGATVVIVLETANMSLAAQGVALSSGGHDDVIEIMNPLSRAVVAARVTGPGRAVILPGTTPLVAPTRAISRIPEVAN